MTVQFPQKLYPLFQPNRFKSIRGGRDGAKSWSVAAALVEIAAADEAQLKAWGLWCGVPEFIVCARETQKSLDDSVHRLLENTIERLGMRSQFNIERGNIAHKQTGAEFVFKGLHHNPEAIKSLERCTRLWIEEAQGLSDDSWRQAIPTVRVANSEIWATWNPRLETDPTWKRLVVDPDPGTIDIQMNFSDNPWYSSVLEPARVKMQRDNPDEYAHVWLGQPRRALEGAVYANELRLADEQGRISSVPHKPGFPVYTGWDLGDGDFTAIWFMQAIGGQYRFINYFEDCHKPMSYYLAHMESLKARFGYEYATAFFPWDAASKVLVNSFEDAMRRDGLNVKVNPRQSIENGIDKVREMFGSSWYDAANCADGVNRLRYYRYGFTAQKDPATGNPVTTRQPIHDDNSHGADAKRTLAMGYRQPAARIIPTMQRKPQNVSAWA